MATTIRQQESGYAGDSAGKFSSQRVARSSLFWIFVAQGVAIAPLFYFLPLWLLVIWLLAILTRVQIYRGVWPYPSNIIKLLFGVMGAMSLYWSYGSFGVEPMIGFMVVSFVLKLIEVRHRTDVLIVLYISFVAVATQLLLSQSAWMSLYGLMSCWVTITAMRAVFQHRSISVAQQLSASGVLILKSLPLMLVLFLVMPRLGQLWAVPSLTGKAKTGFSDTMSPGDFSQLVKSDEIAFRVSFEGRTVPPPSERYWRGLVLEQFDGKHWSRRGAEWLPIDSGGQPAAAPHPHWNLRVQNETHQGVGPDQPIIEDVVYRYSILMEPHQYQWLFVLMVPIEATSRSKPLKFIEPVLLVSQVPVNNRFQYNVISSHQYGVFGVQNSAASVGRNLLLPEKGNANTRALVHKWQSQTASAEQLIDKALDFYAQSFTYTLRPPTLGKNSIDDFLFSSQRGFCEHFASSFVFLMRAAGIPARVVVGYLGGEYNESVNHMVIRQSDAHAWAEVWLENRGWVRVDPTSAVSPDRIERSLYESLDASEERLVGGALMRIGALVWVAKLRYQLEEWDYLWQTRVLNYNDKSQYSFFDKLLGGTEPWRVAGFLVGSISLLLLSYALFNRLRRSKPILPAEQKFLMQVFRKLERLGIVRLPQESVDAYTRRASLIRPELAESLQKITELFSQVAYEGHQYQLPALQQIVSRFERDFKASQIQSY